MGDVPWLGLDYYLWWFIDDSMTILLGTIAVAAGQNFKSSNGMFDVYVQNYSISSIWTHKFFKSTALKVQE